MKKLLLTLLYLSSYHIYAQSGFSVGLATSLDRTAVNPSFTSGYNKGGLGYSAGFRLRYDLNTWLSCQNGFSAFSTRYIADRDGLTYRDHFATGHPETDKFRAVTDLKSFQIPLLFSFYFGNRFKAGFTAGTCLNYLYRINREITWYYNDASESQTRSNLRIEEKNVYMSAIAGIGCEYDIEKFVVRLEPTAQYAFLENKFNHKKDIYPYWSLGLGISAFYRF